MAQHAVAFETLNEPQIGPSTDAGQCLAFSWDVIFFVTQGSGLNPGKSSRTGQIIQQVTINKSVSTCEDKPDDGNSDKRSLVEAFELKEGETNTDAVQIGFPKKRKTVASITLEAAWRADLNGLNVLQTFADPSQNISGASALLGAPPADFAPTLVRTIELTVDCCGEIPSWSMVVRCRNTFGTYTEELRRTSGQEEGTVTKQVDGKSVR